MNDITFSWSCPHCGREKIGFTCCGEKEVSANGVGKLNNCLEVDSIFQTFWTCNHCGNGLILKMSVIKNGPSPVTRISKLGVKALFYDEYMGTGIRILDSWPEPERTSIPNSLPDEIKACFEKAVSNFDSKTRDEEACMLFRKTLDIATKELLKNDAKEQTLHNRIEMLAKKNLLTQDLADWAHEIRSAGNDFIHENTPERKDAEDLELLCRLFLLYVYTLPRMLGQRRPEEQETETDAAA